MRDRLEAAVREQIKLNHWKSLNYLPLSPETRVFFFFWGGGGQWEESVEDEGEGNIRC